MMPVDEPWGVRQMLTQALYFSSGRGLLFENGRYTKRRASAGGRQEPDWEGCIRPGLNVFLLYIYSSPSSLGQACLRHQ